MKQGLITGLRFLISVLLLSWLLWANRGGFAQLREVDPGRLWWAALVFAISTVLGAWQWALILRRADITIGHGRLQAMYWVGLFFNNFLPGNVGGDLVKVSDVAVQTGYVARAVAGTLLDRMLGLSALVSVGLVAAALLGDEAPAGLPWWALGGLVAAVVLASAGLLSGRLGRLLMAVVGRLRAGECLIA